MALSVGMFQRPVSYKLNCLEMVYEFSGLQLRSRSPRENICLLNYKENMEYSGKAIISLCFQKNSIFRFNISIKYEVDALIITEIDELSPSLERIEEARSFAIESYNKKLNFYMTMLDWIKFQLVDKGFKSEDIYRAEFIFDFRFYDESENVFYLKHGSIVTYNSENVFDFYPAGQDNRGHSLWISPYFEGARTLSNLDNQFIFHSGQKIYHDKMIISAENLTKGYSSECMKEALNQAFYDYLFSINFINCYYDRVILDAKNGNC